VFIIHSAHLVGKEAPADMRLLPMFHALDQFKAAQERDARNAAGDYSMRALSGALPDPNRAAAELTAAMEAWDAERAERAAAALARNPGGFAHMWRFGARDYRNIGHKAIYTANACRTLDAIGREHAEPVMRSIALSHVDFGKDQQVNGYAFEDQCYAGNVRRIGELAPKLPGNWATGKSNPAATRALLETLRTLSPDEACASIGSALREGKATASSVWDAIHLAASELMMRTRSSAIVGIHAVTSANGMHYAWVANNDPAERLLFLLQGAGWIAQFRTWAQSREPNLRTHPITEIEASREKESAEDTLEGAFANIGASADQAVPRVLRLAADPATRKAFVTRALSETIVKANEVHHYKYLAALVEDTTLVSPEWQPHLLAAMTYYGKGTNDKETPVMMRAREAVKGLRG
jgi:hypothetical protein